MAEGFVGFVFLVLLAVLYFVPGIIAQRRGHHNTTAIVALNVLLGWTFIGWVGALVWACTTVKNQPE
jgi:uncharacterized membrane protein YqaE (UPF0057 family)